MSVGYINKFEVGSQKSINEKALVTSYKKLSEKIPDNFLPSRKKCTQIICKYNLADKEVTTAIAVNVINEDPASIWFALEQVVSKSRFFMKMLHIHFSIIYHCCLLFVVFCLTPFINRQGYN